MRKTWLLSALLLAIIAGGSYGLFLYLRPAPLPEQLLYGNGHIEGTEVRVAVEVAGRVVESGIDEGVTVTKGDLLLRLDDADFILRKEQAEAGVEARRREREQAERELQVWRHHYEIAERELSRYRELGKRGTVTPQRVEEAENAFRSAQGRVGALEAEIGAAEGRIEAARKELAVVANQLKKTRVFTPVSGTVLAKTIEVGEFAQPGRTVAILADLSRIELKVFIPEKDIGKVKLDASARVRVDAFPDRLFEGRVARVDQQAQFTPRDIHMPEERTRMVFGVTLVLDNPDGVLKPGMPADAWILWDSGARWPPQLFVPQ
ncbi:HlyD family secretion protein [Rhodobacteraceae bacterium MBR-64]